MEFFGSGSEALPEVAGSRFLAQKGAGEPRPITNGVGCRENRETPLVMSDKNGDRNAKRRCRQWRLSRYGAKHRRRAYILYQSTFMAIDERVTIFPLNVGEKHAAEHHPQNNTILFKKTKGGQKK